MKYFIGQPVLFWVSSYMSLWSNILFNCAVLINLIVAVFYPFNDSVPSEYFLQTHQLSMNQYNFFIKIEIGSHLSGLIWATMLASAAIVITLPRETGIRTLVASTILRLIFSLGPEPTLWLLGTLTVILQKKYMYTYLKKIRF